MHLTEMEAGGSCETAARVAMSIREVARNAHQIALLPWKT